MESNYFHSVVLNPERCVGCTSCLKICPTEAIRVHNGKASIIAKRCIDCGECIRICPNRAKNSVTDSLELLKKFKYTIGLILPVFYSQFSSDISPLKILSAVKALGFNEAHDTSMGSEIVDAISAPIIEKYSDKPVINSSCPAIIRLIQVRFPELLNNVLNIETSVEITARLTKSKAAEKTGLSMGDIGVILLTPCTARVTSIKNPLGIDHSFIDGTISIKDIYGLVLKALYSNSLSYVESPYLTSNSIMWNTSGGQIASYKYKNVLAVDGINDAIAILEEIEMGKLDNTNFIQIMACSEGCLGGPLMIENKHIALNNLKNIAAKLKGPRVSEENIQNYMEIYNSGYIKLTKKIKPQAVMSLDSDIKISIQKMDSMQNIVNNLPGINCGVCGSPTCRAFAEDVVVGNRTDCICPVSNILNSNKKDVNT